MGGSSSKNFVNAFDPNKNGVAKTFNPNTNGVAKAFQPVAKALNPTTNRVANAFTKVLPAAFVTTGAVLSQNLNPNTNGVTASFNQIPAALKNVPVFGQLPITQLITGNTSGFVNSLQNEFNMGVNTLGLGPILGSLPGLNQIIYQPPGNQPVQQQPVLIDTNLGNLGNASGQSATSSGSDPGQYQPMYADNMGAPPNYYGIPLDVWIIGGVIGGLFLIR